MYLRLAEFVLCAIAVWFVITQIIIPGFCGTKSFPILKKEAKLKEKLTEIRQEVKEKKIEKTIDQIKKKMEGQKTETINPKEGA